MADPCNDPACWRTHDVAGRHVSDLPALSPEDDEACRLDVALYGSAFVHVTPTGARRIPAVEFSRDAVGWQRPEGGDVVPWWETKPRG
jgi:hypothetical protein